MLTRGQDKVQLLYVYLINVRVVKLKKKLYTLWVFHESFVSRQHSDPYMLDLVHTSNTKSNILEESM